ncbi:valine--tRNA ligase, partial [Candidatus Saccharibacteria bacterium]|nr:valine--tRNA ligase [Candidatus Saccharibacteria bacterium]
MKLPSVYEPGQYEKGIYSLWERGRVFSANPHSTKEHFSISMPPPNETGNLHVGHALFITLQDIMARHARQQGKDVLWLPGTDHAALATNAIVEKQLTEQGTDKHQVGREEFIKIVKEFVGNSRNTINSQIRAMGASCDWSRLRYTLDDALNRCVNEVFVQMYQDGLIYRGHRIVNWDPKLETTVSDDEVVYKEEKAPFYTLQYGPFQIGTARPETKFGDKYVVMHPEDERYAQYKHGNTFEAEWINGPVKATVIKDRAIDPEFGTGVMTITPWHDHTDFDIAERHGLEKAQIIGFDGKLLPIAGEFAGKKIDEVRPKIVEKLRSKGLLVKEEDYTHNVAINDRGKGVIEPQIMLQWFVDVNRPAVQWKGQLRSLREVMRAVVEDSDIKVIPKRFEKTYFHWIDNLHDWCISRQIWWGHQIPVWYKGEEIYTGVQPPKGLPAGRQGREEWKQDPDTLDTWFSSALWTWSTLINPELADDHSLSLEDLLKMSPDFKAYHPTSVMETGWDILFFWVARMILATTYIMSVTNQPEDERIPFKTVYLHGLVRAESGKKMSKSDPDSMIDPLEVIPQYGTDALRLALVSGVNAGQDQRLGRARIVDNRNFCNKLWNIARYIEGAAGDVPAEAEPKSIADHWILNKLSILTDQVDKDLTNFKFSEAYQKLYHFVWDDLADWYIEASKSELNPGLLKYVLETTLTVAHPFAPFITEAIWQNLKLKKGQLLASELLPDVSGAEKKEAAKFEGLKRLVAEIRGVAAMTGEKPENIYYQKAKWLEEQEKLLNRLARIKSVNELSGEPKNLLRLTSVEGDFWVDIDSKKARPKIEENLKKYRQAMELLKKRLDAPGYSDKAPKELVAQTEKELQEKKKKKK